MATYKKRGYKPKAVKETVENEIEDTIAAEDIESTTAEVFNTLDETANKTEEWVAANQKYIFGIVGALALVALAYIAFDRFVKEPKEVEAANEIFQAQKYFTQAQEASSTQKDSLYGLALNGGEGKLGLLDVIDQYGSTKTGNIANYYAGISYLNTKDYKNAITYLDKFKSKDYILQALAYGALGDSFAQLEKGGVSAEALDYYNKAANLDANNFTTPKFLLKAAKMAIATGDTSTAIKNLETIASDYPKSNEYPEVETLLAKAKAM
ncbi:tetratricopeptide repeat protein [Aquimarina agarilytica]|uniref:tetratricopeptide repeat protein n=1 Tax=Aquimarina agarilytica TaxID=1087449 RepID=UPI000287F6EA|nr:tetratricopeptide repeat protein [Aquimarina agarilytica]